MLSVRGSREQGGGERFAWLKDRSEDRAKGGMRERKRERKREKTSVPWRRAVEANESKELTVERTGQDRERETD